MNTEISKSILMDAVEATLSGKEVRVFGGQITLDDAKRALRLYPIRPNYIIELAEYRARKAVEK